MLAKHLLTRLFFNGWTILGGYTVATVHPVPYNLVGHRFFAVSRQNYCQPFLPTQNLDDFLDRSHARIINKSRYFSQLLFLAYNYTIVYK